MLEDAAGQSPGQPAAKGSQRRMREWVGQAPETLSHEVRSAFAASLAPAASLRWVSPLASNGFKELRDELWSEAGLDGPTAQAEGFWPRRGPVWDGVARVEHEGRVGVVLVEAKSHAAELRSPGTAAKGDGRRTIDWALAETKAFLGVPPETPWADRYYQVANRLAYLYFLRKRTGVPAWLCSVYFLGDSFTSGARNVLGPVDAEGWTPEIERCKQTLGLPSEHELSAYTAEVFLRADGWSSAVSEG